MPKAVGKYIRTEAIRNKQSAAMVNRFTGDKSHMWTGDAVGYSGVHHWIRKNLGKPNKCVECGREDNNTKYNWANISRKYKRDLSDWKRLCRKCHMQFDRLSFTGSKNGRAILNEKKVLKIRKLYKTNKYSHNDLAKIFNISKRVIFSILHNEIWKHI